MFQGRLTIESANVRRSYTCDLCSNYIVPCPALSPPENGTVVVSRYSEGGVATFSCDEGFTFSPEGLELVCQVNGTWTNNEEVVNCVEVRQTTPPTTAPVLTPLVLPTSSNIRIAPMCKFKIYHLKGLYIL